MKKKWNKPLILSIILNIFLMVVVIFFMLDKLGILTKSSISPVEHEYLNNPQYEASVTMFQLVDSDGDVIFAGDSITAFGRFSEFFPDVKVMNRGISNDTTEGLYNRIDEVLSHHPKKIFIMIGINDIARNVSKDESLKYYELIISEIKREIPNCEIYVQSILPTRSDDLSAIQERNESILQMCEENSIEYINLYDLFLVEGRTNVDLLSADGVHLNGKGYRVWIDAVKTLVVEGLISS